jgi:integrase
MSQIAWCPMLYNDDMGRPANHDGAISYDESRKRWRGRVQISREAGVPRYRNVSGRTKKEVSEKLEALREQSKREEGLVDAASTLESFLEIWLKEVVEPYRASGTYQGYAGHVRNHIVPLLGKERLADLPLMKVQLAFNELHKQGMHPTTLRRVRATLASALTYAGRAGYIPPGVNVARHLNLPTASKTAFPVLDQPELVALLRACENDMPYGMLFRLAAVTGMRASELAGIRWAHIDLKEGLVSVEGTMKRAKAQWKLSPTKNAASVGILTLDDRTVEMLRIYKEQQVFFVREETAWTDLGVVFLNAKGRPLHQATVVKCLRRYCAELDLPPIRLHDLRHGFATMLLEAGENPKLVSEALRHASVSTTMNIYAHVSKGHTRRAVQALADGIDGVGA